MAKQPIVESHRFRIYCEADSAHMGPILAQLTLMGVDNIGYELITDVKAYGGKPKQPHGMTAQEQSVAWIAEHPTFRVRDLGQYFKEIGRPATTAHYVTRVMTEQGLLRNLGEGNYQSVDVKLIEAPKPVALPPPVAKAEPKAAPKATAKASKKQAKPAKAVRTRAPNPVARFEVSNRAMIEKRIKGRKTFNVKLLQQFFRDQGRNAHSVSPILWRMQEDKAIRMISPGEYEVLPTTMSPAAQREANLAAERVRAKNYRDKKKKQGDAEVAPTSGVVSAGDVTEVVNG